MIDGEIQQAKKRAREEFKNNSRVLMLKKIASESDSVLTEQAKKTCFTAVDIS
ncbi:MAG: hypothetical protein ACJ0Q4_00395 [Gammaproteobacteria bacterium]